MKNQEIADIFYKIAAYLEMKDGGFKVIAYRKAALNLESIKEDIEAIYKKGGKKALQKISGIGKSTAEKIEEYLKTGKIKYYQSLKKKTPIKIGELTGVEGLGAKTAKILYDKLKIKNLKDLEKAAKSGKIAPLFGFGETAEKNILEGIDFLKRSEGRLILGKVFHRVQEIKAKLENLKEIKQISVAGSVRRKKEIIGDIDFLVVSKKPEAVMDFFTSMPGVVKVWGKGLTKSSVRMKSGFDMDIRVVSEKSYGSALQYFTGSKDHNIAVRKIAMSKGLKLNEYGLFKKIKNQNSKIKKTNQNSKIVEDKNNWVQIAGKEEKEIYQKLGMEWISPELRENQGEIKTAIAGKLPKLIELKNIKGDLHCHSGWNTDNRLISELSERAIKMGYDYIGISDHTKFLKIEHGLNEKELAEQRKEIDKMNLKFERTGLKFKILQGCEANILKDGSIDIKDEALEKLDFVIAGIHSGLKMEKSKMTERIIRAMKNPNVDIISHLTGRILKKRDEYQIDFGRILAAAKKFKVILEINACPVRLDLNDWHIKKAKEAGVKMIINTDAHQANQLDFMEFGVNQARRGWAEKNDIINTQPLNKLLKYFK